jgi:hypothetical protein
LRAAKEGVPPQVILGERAVNILGDHGRDVHYTVEQVEALAEGDPQTLTDYVASLGRPEGHSVLGIMDIITIAGDQPALGPLQRSARAMGRFGGLIEQEAD